MKKRPDRLRRWQWADPVYDVRVFLLKGPGEQARVWINKTFTDGEDLQGAFTGAKTVFVTGDSGVALVIWVPQWWNAKDSHHLGVLAHEALHGASYVLRERGIRFAEPSEEAFAYYVTWLFGNCHRRLTT